MRHWQYEIHTRRNSTNPLFCTQLDRPILRRSQRFLHQHLLQTVQDSYSFSVKKSLLTGRSSGTGKKPPAPELHSFDPFMDALLTQGYMVDVSPFHKLRIASVLCLASARWLLMYCCSTNIPIALRYQPKHALSPLHSVIPFHSLLRFFVEAFVPSIFSVMVIGLDHLAILLNSSNSMFFTP